MTHLPPKSLRELCSNEICGAVSNPLLPLYSRWRNVRPLLDSMPFVEAEPRLLERHLRVYDKLVSDSLVHRRLPRFYSDLVPRYAGGQSRLLWDRHFYAMPLSNRLLYERSSDRRYWP